MSDLYERRVRTSGLDACEVMAIVFIIGGMITLLVFDTIGKHQPIVHEQPTATLWPERDCGHLDGEAFLRCMTP